MTCGCECASNYSPELWCISCAHIKQTGRKCARWAELCPPSIFLKYIFVTLTVMVPCLTGWPSMATCVLFVFSLSPPSHCLGRVHCRLRLCPSHLQLIILHSSFTDGMTFFFLNAVLVLCQMQWDADLDSLKTALNWDTWGLQFCRCCFLWSYLTSRMGSRCTLWVILVGKSILSNHCSNFSPVRKLCTVYGKDQLWIPLQIRWWFLR